MNTDLDETSIADDFSVPIPPSIQSQLDLEPGDRLQWAVEDDQIVADVVRERFIAFDEFDPSDDEDDR